MATEVLLTQWGMGMQDGTVIRWLKREGDSVQEGDELAEIETAKVTEMLLAPATGTLARIAVAEGETIRVRTAMCVIAEPGEAVAVPPGAPDPGRGQVPSPAPTGGPVIPRQSVQASPLARRIAEQNSISLDQVQGTGPDGRITDEDVRKVLESRAAASAAPAVAVQVEPRARRLARENSIDLSNVRGTGPGGRITESDVTRMLETVNSFHDQFVEQVVLLTGMRGAISRRMLASLQNTAQYTMTTEVNVTALVEMRKGLQPTLNLTFSDFIVKAVALALKAHPYMNAWVDGDRIRILPEINIGVAVALDSGLIVPVLRRVDRMSLRQIAGASRELVRRAREGRLGSAEVTGGTFSISNLGMYGIDAFTPVLNPPEVGILGVGRIVERLGRRNADLIWHQMMTLSLTTDHRAVDGAPGAVFLQTVAKHLEEPASLDAYSALQ